MVCVTTRFPVAFTVSVASVGVTSTCQVHSPPGTRPTRTFISASPSAMIESQVEAGMNGIDFSTSGVNFTGPALSRLTEPVSPLAAHWPPIVHLPRAGSSTVPSIWS